MIKTLAGFAAVGVLAWLLLGNGISYLNDHLHPAHTTTPAPYHRHVTPTSTPTLSPILTPTSTPNSTQVLSPTLTPTSTPTQSRTHSPTGTTIPIVRPSTVNCGALPVGPGQDRRRPRALVCRERGRMALSPPTRRHRPRSWERTDP